MKKLLIFLAFLLLAGAGYFTYDHWVKNANLSIWSFVPQNSIFVYESKAPLATLQEVKETGVWKNLASLPVFKKLSNRVNTLDSLVGQGAFSSSFENNPALISFNAISSEDFDFLFIIEIQNLTQHAFISKAQTLFTKKTRQYLDFTITELKSTNGQENFTFIFYKNYFIGSFSAFLVEDAIRAIETKDPAPFNLRFPELQLVSKLEQDQGNLYVNFSRLASSISTVRQLPSTLDFGRSAYLDFKITDDQINLSGFTFVDQPNQFLMPFKQPAGSSFNIPEVVPNEASSLLHYQFSDGITFGKELSKYFNLTDRSIGKIREQLKADYEFDVAYTYNFIDEEIGLVTLESPNTSENERLLILEIKDMGEALNHFNSVGEREAISKKDSVYVEFFGDYQIRKLPFAEFPYALLGDVAQGFNQVFYLQHRNYLIFSNSLLRLKNLTLSIENENTWSKSIQILKFLNESNQSANLSYFVNTSRSWNNMTTQLKDSWSSVVQNFQFNLKHFEFLAFQFSSIDNKFYTNFTAFQPEIPDDRFPQKTSLLESITMANYLITKPHLITNHNTKEKEIVVQDSAYILYQFSNNFEILWSQELNEPLKSDVHQIDYYKNGKLQIAFATAKQIHILDRNGEYIPGFPKTYPSDRPIAYFKPVDYDNSKNYRFVISDSNGKVFLTDKDVKPLTGWSPKTFDFPLASAPEHFRIGGKDVFCITLESGQIYLFNRKGDLLPGFPVDLKSNLKGNFFIKESNDLKSSILSTITENGELIKLNLNGELLKRDQLYKPTLSTTFKLIKNVSQSEFVLLRQTENKYELLKDDGTSLFTKDYFAGKPLYYQYYNLGADTRFIVFVDPSGSYLYIYDMAGVLITGRPLAATRPISLWKYGNEYLIYRCMDQNLELISLSF